VGRADQKSFTSRERMSTTKIRIDEYVKLEDFPERLGAYTKIELLKGQKEAIARGIQRSIPDLVKASPVDQGLYANSWDFTVNEKLAIIGNSAPHAPIIEFGARPFTPPIGPLLAWAKRVLGDGSQPPKYSPEVWELAKGTQLKIQREGMQPKHILQKMMPKILANIKIEIERAP